MSRRLTFSVSLVALAALFTVDSALAQGRFFRRTIIVNPVPGDPIRSGNRLLRSIASVGGATASDPWLVRVEAGTYDIEGDTLIMPSFVDIEGSGQDVTTITGYAPGAAVVEGAADSELRNLTVEHRGDGAGGWAVGNSGDRFSMHRLTALGSGGASAGLVNRGNETTASEITVRVIGTASGTGLNNSGSGGVWKCVRASVQGSGIVYALFNSKDGEFIEVVADAESSDAFAGAIRNEGGSPIMRNVHARAKGAGGQAITNGASSNAQLFDVVAEAFSTTDFAVGVSNQFGSPILKNVHIRAEGVLGGFGIANFFGANVTMYEVNATATGGTGSAGLLTDGSTSVAHNSTFKGEHFSVDNRFDASASSILGSTQLDGPVRVGAGILKCVASYDGAFNPLTAVCLP